MKLPWRIERRSASGGTKRTGGYNPGSGANYRYQRAGFTLAACQLYGSTLAAAAPENGPLNGDVLCDMGYRLGLRGWWAGVIEVGADGELTVTPFDATPYAGMWHGSTREHDGFASRNLRVPAAAVFRIRLPVQPVGAGSSTREMLEAAETALLGEARTGLHGRAVLTIPIEERASRPEQWTDIADWLQERYGAQRGAGLVPVLPPGVKPSQMGGEAAVEGNVLLRDQAFAEVEAQFGIPGLLRSATDGAAAHAYWRLAVVRTFTPIAKMIEAEALRKLEAPANLNIGAWFAAAHGDRARLIAARAGAMRRLTEAGMSIADAREAVAAFDDD